MRKWREHNSIVRRWLAAVMACMLALLCLCPAAFAIDKINEQASCSLTVNFHPGGTNGDGTQIKLYRVANMTGFGDFSPVGRFNELDESMNGLEDGEWDVLARKLISHVDSLGISPMATGTVTDGKVSFEGLPVGLYLISCDVVVRNATFYITNPMLVSLPNHSDPDDPDAWKYDVTVSPKPSQVSSAKFYIRKVWQNTSSADRKPVTIHLMVNGKVAETVVLSSANDWRAELQTQLKNGESWSVVEATKLSGFYTPTWDWNWDGRNINVYVTNTKKPPYTPPTSGPTPTPKPNYPPVLPQTGLLWWPVPVLAVGGMLLFGLGWARRRHREEN